jgi:uncharacterized membrane protein YtjA (UPF0391 family)
VQRSGLDEIPNTLLKEPLSMLHYAAVFFVIAIVAAIFGFGGIAAGAVGAAKILFFVALALGLVSLLARGRATVP